MNSTPLPVVVIAAGLSAVIAASTTLLLHATGPSEPREAPTSAATGTSETDVLAQIQELRRESRELRDRLTMLETRPAAAVRVPADSVSREELAALERDLRESLSIPEAPVPPPEEFKSQVAEALTSIRKDEAVAKARGAHEKRVAQREQRLAKVTEWLGLDSYQTGEMRALMTAKDDGERELIRMWDEGVDTEVLGEAKRAHAEELQAALERVLTPAQLEAYRRGYDRGGKQ